MRASGEACRFEREKASWAGSQRSGIRATNRRRGMGARNDNLIWMAVGGLGALLLAVVLVPLRTLTSASNLAFAFLAFTIVIAEVGGRSAALLTAVVSAMSLNFFLTEPYLTLAITKPDDVVAFLALAICGLIAAAFGRRRERMSDAAAR